MKTNLKPFDLEAAKAGASVVTRDGRPVRIICTDAMGGEYPVIALVREDDWELSKSYTSDGKHISCGTESKHDLIMAPVKRKGWMNLYRSDVNSMPTGSYVYDSEKEAMGKADNVWRIATVPVEWEE